MALIDKAPAREVVGALKGTVDFACWRGLYYARSWPRAPKLPRSTSVQAQYAAYGYISQQAQAIDQSTKDALSALADTTNRTWRDWQITLFYGYDIALEPDPSIDKAFEPEGFDTWKIFS